MKTDKPWIYRCDYATTEGLEWCHRRAEWETDAGKHACNYHLGHLIRGNATACTVRRLEKAR